MIPEVSNFDYNTQCNIGKIICVSCIRLTGECKIKKTHGGTWASDFHRAG